MYASQGEFLEGTLGFIRDGLAAQLCELVQLRSSADGSVVRAHLRRA
jgi:hypothetical protein